MYNLSFIVKRILIHCCFDNFQIIISSKKQKLKVLLEMLFFIIFFTACFTKSENMIDDSYFKWECFSRTMFVLLKMLCHAVTAIMLPNKDAINNCF